MRSKRLQEAPERTYVLVFDKGEEVISGLEAFARQEGLSGSAITGIGALRRLTLGYFEAERKDYIRIPIDEQVEVVSLVGNVAIDDGEPALHVHIVVAKKDGTAYGGHLLDAQVWPTLEVVFHEQPGYLQRRTDPETGLALLAP
jgi:predicted DNA-binding protein with PD1-like motif